MASFGNRPPTDEEQQADREMEDFIDWDQAADNMQVNQTSEDLMNWALTADEETRDQFAAPVETIQPVASFDQGVDFETWYKGLELDKVMTDIGKSTEDPMNIDTESAPVERLILPQIPASEVGNSGWDESSTFPGPVSDATLENYDSILAQASSWAPSRPATPISFTEEAPKKGKKKTFGPAAFFNNQTRREAEAIRAQTPSPLPPTVPDAEKPPARLFANKKTAPEIRKPCICKPVEDKVKRPTNNFMLYRKDRAAHYHSLGYNNNGSISRMVGEDWARESPEVKDEYTRRARQVSMLHGMDHPGYTYSPGEDARKAFGDEECRCGAYQVNMAVYSASRNVHDETEEAFAAPTQQGQPPRAPRPIVARPMNVRWAPQPQGPARPPPPATMVPQWPRPPVEQHGFAQMGQGTLMGQPNVPQPFYPQALFPQGNVYRQQPIYMLPDHTRGLVYQQEPVYQQPPFPQQPLQHVFQQPPVLQQPVEPVLPPSAVGELSPRPLFPEIGLEHTDQYPPIDVLDFRRPGLQYQPLPPAVYTQPPAQPTAQPTNQVNSASSLPPVRRQTRSQGRQNIDYRDPEEDDIPGVGSSSESNSESAPPPQPPPEEDDDNIGENIIVALPPDWNEEEDEEDIGENITVALPPDWDQGDFQLFSDPEQDPEEDHYDAAPLFPDAESRESSPLSSVPDDASPPPPPSVSDGGSASPPRSPSESGRSGSESGSASASGEDEEPTSPAPSSSGGESNESSESGFDDDPSDDYVP